MGGSATASSAEPFNEVHVCKILRTTCRTLVPQECLTIQEPDCDPVDLARDLRRPRLVECDGVQASQEIHSVWRSTKLDHAIVGLEVSGLDAERRKTKLAQSLNDPRSVVCRWANEAIDVLGEARVSMEGNRVASDNKKFNAVRVEQSEQFAQIPV